MRLKIPFMITVLFVMAFSCKPSIMEELNDTACSCYEADLNANVFDKELFSCFEAGNFENLEELILIENSTLTKEQQGEIMADSLIRYSIKHCMAMHNYFTKFRAVTLEKNKALLEKNTNITRQLLWDSTHTALNLTKVQYGVALYMFNENNKAKQVLQEIATDDTNYQTAAGFLAWAYEKDGDTQKARSIYQDLVRRFPENYEYLLLLEMSGEGLE